MITKVDDSTPYLEVLKSFGIPSDAVIFVSSDIGVFARNNQKQGERFSPDDFVTTLQQLVPDGTLVIPAYTDDLTDGSTFDYEKSKPTTGALSNKVLRRKDFSRTNDPLHSVLVWGKESQRFMDCEDESTFGPHSIFALLHELDVYFIFIDIHIQECFTYIHYVEECKRVRYRRYYNYVVNYLRGGEQQKMKTKFYSKRLGVISDIRRLHDQFEQGGDYSTIHYRGSKIDLLRSQLVFEKASVCIEQGPALYTFSLVKFAKDFVKRYILRKKGIL